MSNYYRTVTSFAVGQSQTEAIKLNEKTICGLIVTGSHITATSITFLGSGDGVTYYPLYDDASTEVSITTGSYARAYSLLPTTFYAWNYAKVREGTSASAVLQAGSDINIEIITRNI
jgi:hypothetical protein